MELTIDEALRQGNAAQKEGKFQEAERLYRTILQSQPTHPYANHNLGVLAVSVNKADAALPLFKTALEANPKIENFWLSYIDTLIKEKQFETAKQVLADGEKTGLAGEKVDALQAQLTLEIKNPGPPQSELNSLLEHYQNRRYDDAEKLALSITKQFPNHPFGWTVLAAVIKQTGRLSESVVVSEKVIALAPEDAKAHYSLGDTLRELGRLEEAEASYSQAIELKPDFVEAHSNLGTTLQELGRLEEAEASYRQAIALKSDFAEAHSNLGTTLRELGRLAESEASYRQAIAVKSDFAEAHYNLGVTLLELKRFDSALSSYEKAVNAKENYNKAISGIGKALIGKGRHKEGLNKIRTGDGSISFDIKKGLSIK